MIYISIEGKQPPGEWLEKAKTVTEQLEAAGSPEERNQIIDKKRQIWGELKDWLLDLSHGKCWFSEAKDIYSHWDVEHFRPKKSAKDLDGNEREGYWWLAFEWTNFRICGNVGNRKKGTFFPLRPGSQPATSANRNIEDEVFYFLDPTRPDDPCLLSFNEAGEAIPMPGIQGWHQERADISIKRFKLNDHIPLREARQRIWNECRTLISKCSSLLKDLEEKHSVVKQERLRAKFQELREMVQPDQLLSSVAKECLNASGYRWALRIASGG